MRIVEDMELKQTDNGQHGSERSGLFFAQKKEQYHQRAAQNQKSSYPNVRTEQGIEGDQYEPEIRCLYQVIAFFGGEIGVVDEIPYLNRIQPFIRPCIATCNRNQGVGVCIDERKMKQCQARHNNKGIIFGELECQ